MTFLTVEEINFLHRAFLIAFFLLCLITTGGASIVSQSSTMVLFHTYHRRSNERCISHVHTNGNARTKFRKALHVVP